MDIKAEIEKIVKKITGDSSLKEKFGKNPVDTVKSLVGNDVPSDAISKIVDGVKAKVSLDNASGVVSKVKGLFKK